jgi:nicotinamidase-related amidase
MESGERKIRKTTCDAFYRTTLESELRSIGATALLLTGYATEFCVDSTLRNAASKDFQVVVASDAHTTNDQPVLPAKLVREHYNWTWANCSSGRGIKVCAANDLVFPAA